MKNKTRRLASVLVALLLLVLSAVPVSAVTYSPVTPSNSTINHRLRLTEAPYYMPYSVTYSFAVGSATVSAPSGGAVADFISGAPSISSITYDSADDFTANADHAVSKTAEVDWSGVQFKGPGIFYWDVTKSHNGSALPEPLSNNAPTQYLWAYVIDDGGVLKVSAVGLADNTALSSKIDMIDTYPSHANNLAVRKMVDGTLGAKDQYFKFTATITLPAGVASKAYTVSGLDDAATVNASPYNSGAVQPGATVTLNAGANEVVFWLKHSQTAVITELPFNTQYSIVESENEGYVVTIKNNNGVDATSTGATAAGKIGDVSVSVQYENTKAGATPTGVFLSVAPAVSIIVLGGLGLIVLLASRRKRHN